MVRLTLVPIIFFIVVNTVLLKLIQRDNRQLIYNRHRVGLKAKPLASLLFPIISILPREHFTEETVVGFLLVLVVCLNRFFKSGYKPLHFPDIINFARKSSFSYG